MCQTVITTMKTYGLILADNGSNWYFQGTADTRWTDTEVDQLKQIPASEFVAVDESCLMVQANSGQALPTGDRRLPAELRLTRPLAAVGHLGATELRYWVALPGERHRAVRSRRGARAVRPRR